MANVPKFICPSCESENCELQFSTVGGHRIPGLWRCLEPGCGWEGKLRKIVFVDVPEQPSPYTKKSARQVAAGTRRGETHLMTKEQKAGITVVVPSMTEKWKETMEKIAAMIVEGSAENVESEEVVEDAGSEVPEKLEGPEEPGIPDPRSTCPVSCSLSCPSCEEPLVEILTSCTGTVKWTYQAPAGPENASGWYWHVQESWSYRCPVCEEELPSRHLEDEIPYIRRKEYLDDD